MVLGGNQVLIEQAVAVGVGFAYQIRTTHRGLDNFWALRPMQARDRVRNAMERVQRVPTGGGKGVPLTYLCSGGLLGRGPRAGRT
jgi:hypothetical protein